MGKRARALTIAAALLVALVAPAPLPAAAVEFAVSGMVTANGAPLAGVVVYAYVGGDESVCCEPVSGAVTAADGTYSIALEPGSYRVRFYPNTDGLVEEWWDAAPDFASGADVVVGGANVSGIDASLVQGFTITGTITLVGGGALGGIGVHAMDGSQECCVWVTGTETDPDGTFALTVPNGTYRLYIYSSGIELSEWHSDAASFEEADDITIAGAGVTGVNAALAEASRTIRGVVTDDGGAPMPFVYVHAFDGSGPCCTWVNGAETNDAGEFALAVAEGQYILLFYPPSGLMEWYANALEFETATPIDVTAASATGISAQLMSGNIISGTVTAGGLPQENVFVGAFDASDLCCTWIAGASTDATGAYRLEVPDGVYRLQFYPWDGAHLPEWFSNADAFELAVDVAVLNNDLPGLDVVLSTGTSISGTVTGGGGPLEWVYVGAYRAAGECCEWVGGAGTDATGAYTMTVPAGTYKLMFYPYDGVFAPEWWNNKDDFETATAVTVGASDVVVGNADLSAGVAITGTVITAGGAPIENAYVMAFQVSGLDLMWAGGASTGSDGTYSIVVGDGQYKIQFYGPDPFVPEWYDNAGDDFSADEVTVNGLNVTANATLEAGLTISGTVEDGSGQPIPGVTVLASTSCVGDFVNGTGTDGLGTYSMTLPSGNYRISFWADGYVTEWWNDATTCDTSTAVAAGSALVDPAVLVAGTGMITISGVVVDADTGDPLEGIDVTLLAYDGNDTMYGTTTAANGTYQLGIPGTVTQGNLRFAHPQGSYVEDVSNGLLVTGNMTENRELGPLVVTVTGQIGDNYALQALFEAVVTAYFVVREGDSVLQGDVAGVAESDENGDYVLDLGPGEYALRFTAEGYVVQWYGGWSSFEEATPPDAGGTVLIQCDCEYSGFGAALEPVRFDVSGTITEDGIGVDGAVQWTDQSNGALNSVGTFFDDAWQYSIQLPAGTYDVQVTNPGSGCTYSDTVTVSGQMTRDFTLSTEDCVPGE